MKYQNIDSKGISFMSEMVNIETVHFDGSGLGLGEGGEDEWEDEDEDDDDDDLWKHEILIKKMRKKIQNFIEIM